MESSSVKRRIDILYFVQVASINAENAAGSTSSTLTTRRAPLAQTVETHSRQQNHRSNQVDQPSEEAVEGNYPVNFSIAISNFTGQQTGSVMAAPALAISQLLLPFLQRLQLSEEVPGASDRQVVNHFFWMGAHLYELILVQNQTAASFLYILTPHFARVLILDLFLLELEFQILEL